MKNIFASLLLLFSFVTLQSQTLFTGKVIGIKDGDTVEILDSNNKKTTLRLAEVDCPERKQAFGTRAKQFTSDQVYLRTINYSVTNKDRYGRSVAKIYYGTKYLSAEIIKYGMGWHYKKHSKSKELARLEQQARAKRVGLWIDPNPINPADWRKAKRNASRKY